MHHIDTATTGIIGASTPIAAAVVSLDPALDLQLRVTSMVIGILVGIISFAKLIYDLWADHKNRRKK
jgi:hypothetical protein